jgi:transposase
MKSIKFVGLDVHAETIAVAVAEQGGEVRSLGVIPNREESIRKLVKKLGPVEQLRFCYEAGPTGYVVYWQLTRLGAKCEVVAPTLVPVKSGERVKTDRRDALKLARCYRAGELTAVWVPDAEHEALRDLVRAREAAKKDQLRAKHRLGKFLLRHGRRPPTGVKPWTLKYLSWVKQEVHFEQPAQEATLLDYLREVEHAEARIAQLDLAVEEAVKSTPPKMKAVIEGLQALRGVAQVAAVTIVAEVGELSRFTRAPQLMGYGGYRSERTFQWRKQLAWGHHQDRECTLAAGGGGGRLGVPPPAQRGWSFAETAGGSQRRSPRDRLESTASPVYALSQANGTGQGQGEGDNRHRTRALGIYLGHWRNRRGDTEGDPTANSIR